MTYFVGSFYIFFRVKLLATTGRTHEQRARPPASASFRSVVNVLSVTSTSLTRSTAPGAKRPAGMSFRIHYRSTSLHHQRLLPASAATSATNQPFPYRHIAPTTSVLPYKITTTTALAGLPFPCRHRTGPASLPPTTTLDHLTPIIPTTTTPTCNALST